MSPRTATVILLSSVAAAAIACEPRDVVTPNIPLSFYVEDDGQTSDAGVASNAGQLRLHAVVGASGQWPLTITLTGALAFQSPSSGSDGGTSVQTTVPASGGSDDLSFPVVVVSPRGEANVTGTVGSTVANASFQVNPSTASLSLCIADVDGGCAAPSTGTGASDAGVADATSASGDLLVALPPLAPDMWSVGDIIPLRLDAPAIVGSDAGLDTRTVHIRTTGSLALPAPSGTTMNAEDDVLPVQVNTVWRSLVVTGSGPGSASAWLNEGMPQQLSIRGVPPAVGVREVRADGMLGSTAVDAVGLCSTFASGSLVVSVSAGAFGDGGVVAVTPAGPGACPTGYRGRYVGTWLGVNPSVTWTLLDPHSGATNVQTLPMLGTVSSVSARLTSGDGGSVAWEPTDGGNSYARVTIAFSSLYDGGAPTPLVASVITSVVGDPMGQATVDPPATTAADGTVTVLVTAPPRATSVVLTFRIDNRYAVSVTIPGPA